MTGKKSRLFPGKSAKPDSSNINPSSSNNAAPSSSQRTGTSFALPITPQPNAHPAQDEISEVGSSLTSDSRSLAHAGRDKVSEIGSAWTPSAPSPRKQRAHAKRLRDTAEQHNKRIREVTEGLNEESDVAHLEAFFDQISQLSDFIQKEKQDKEEKKIKEKEKEKEKKKKTAGKKKGEEKENNPSEPKRSLTSWLSSKKLLKLKDVLCEAVSAAKDFTSSGDAKKMAQGLIRDIAGGHAFNIVFIVVAEAWQRYEDMSDDEKKCLSLLEEINEFAKYVIFLKKALQKGLAAKKMLEDVVKKNIELIIETCIACCNHIEASKINRYARRTEYGAELAKYVKKLKKAYERFTLPMCIGIIEEVQQRGLHLPECSKDADIVGETELKRQRALVTQDVKRFSLTTATEIEEFSYIKDKPKRVEKLGHLCYNPELDKENVDGDLSDRINYISNTVTTVETKKPVQLRKADYPEYPKDAVETKKPVLLRKPDYPEYPKDAGKSSSTPSSSRLPKESDYTQSIMEAAAELDKENVDGDLTDLINYISRLFDFIEEKKKEKGKTMGLVKRAGMAHLVTAGILVVPNFLERYEAISTNNAACLSLLKEIDKLARYVNELQKRPELKESMVDSIREAIALIVEASLDCCTQINGQINDTKLKKFFSTVMNGEELAKFKTRLAETYTHLQRNFDLYCLYDVRRQKPMELQYPEHPKGAVGI